MKISHVIGCNKHSRHILGVHGNVISAVMFGGNPAIDWHPIQRGGGGGEGGGSRSTPSRFVLQKLE